MSSFILLYILSILFIKKIVNPFVHHFAVINFFKIILDIVITPRYDVLTVLNYLGETEMHTEKYQFSGYQLKQKFKNLETGYDRYMGYFVSDRLGVVSSGFHTEKDAKNWINQYQEALPSDKESIYQKIFE